MASNTWLIPPVGRGRAGRNIRSGIATAKLFSAKTSFSAPSVLVPSLRSQRSSWSLKGSSISDGRYAPQAPRRLPADHEVSRPEAGVGVAPVSSAMAADADRAVGRGEHDGAVGPALEPWPGGGS